MEATQHDFFQLEFFGQLRSRTIYFGETFLREAWKWEIPDCFKRPDSQISDAQSEDIRKYVATLIYNKTSKKNHFRHLLWRATSYSDRISARLFHIFWAPFLGCPQLQHTKKKHIFPGTGDSKDSRKLLKHHLKATGFHIGLNTAWFINTSQQKWHSNRDW